MIDFAFIERLAGLTSGARRCHLITGYGPNYLLALIALATTLGPGFRQIRCMTYWELVRTKGMTEIDGGLERLGRLLGLEIASEKQTVTYPYLQPDGTSKTRETTTIAMGVARHSRTAHDVARAGAIVRTGRCAALAKAAGAIGRLVQALDREWGAVATLAASAR